MVLAGSATVLALHPLILSVPHTVLPRRKPQCHPTQTNTPPLHLLYERGTLLLQRRIYLGLLYF